MVQRRTLIAALVGVEIALLVMMVQAISPGMHAPWHAAELREMHGFSMHAGGASSDSTFITGASPTVTVDIGYADLTIERHAAAAITVRIPRHGWHGFGSEAPPITAQQHGDDVKVTSPAQRSWTFSDDRVVTIEVPPGTRVTVRNAGNIKATGLRAEASFNSNNGTVTIDDFDAPSLHVASSNGRLQLHDIIAPHFVASTRNGRVEGTALQVRDGRVDSSNGKVSLSFARGSDALVTAASSNGRVSIHDGMTVVAGAAPPENDDADDDDASTAKTVRIGAGSGRLDVRASNGSINLSQEG